MYLAFVTTHTKKGCSQHGGTSVKYFLGKLGWMEQVESIHFGIIKFILLTILNQVGEGECERGGAKKV